VGVGGGGATASKAVSVFLEISVGVQITGQLAEQRKQNFIMVLL